MLSVIDQVPSSGTVTRCAYAGSKPTEQTQRRNNLAIGVNLRNAKINLKPPFILSFVIAFSTIFECRYFLFFQ